MRWVVTLFALTMPPSPMLYRAFETKNEAERWRLWASCLPCHARISKLNRNGVL